MVSIDLTDRRILLTGALGAIAEFVVRRLTEAGATVWCTDLAQPDPARRQLDAWGIPAARSPYLRMDVTDAAEVTARVDELVAKEGPIDCCLGHAGGCGMHPFGSTDAAEFERIFYFNYFGQVNLTRAVTHHWRERNHAGHMIFTSSICGSLPWPDLAAYNSAKAALEMFSRCMALEHAQFGVRFNVVAPGHVAAGSSLKVYQTDPNYRAMTDRVIPLKRLVRPEAIADAFLWLCSSLASDVNGQVIHVDLGTTLPKLGGDS